MREHEHFIAGRVYHARSILSSNIVSCWILCILNKTETDIQLLILRSIQINKQLSTFFM